MGLYSNVMKMPGVQAQVARQKAADPRAAFNQSWQDLRPQQAMQGEQYWNSISSFNPQQSVEQYGRAAAAQGQTYLTESLDRLRGSAVGAGRLDTGFFDSDQGELVRDSQRDLNEKMAMQATNAAQMQLQQYGQMGQYAQGQQQQYYDLLSGELDRRTAEANAKAAKKKALWGGIGSLVGGVGGFLVGGPIGAKAGSYIGGKVGGG